MFCSECKKNEITLVNRFANHLVFNPGELKDATISFSNTEQGKTPDYPIKEVKFSDSTFILLSPMQSKKRITLGELKDIGIVIPVVKNCSFERIWYNETMEVYAKICFPAADTIVLPKTSTPGIRLIPDCEAKLTSERGRQSFLCYNAVITVTGFIRQFNFCHACSTIVCEFIGPNIVIETTPPNRDPDDAVLTPCNSMNTCS